ncbi:hypothetical protein [Flavobacterium noncentrifugens]|uniref:SH3 domain-containing protein n=1 Tax=Flavobacterium noncentrifugens TaxID=1128970 RepID=A0A1G8Y602_9FLAO|nr:hypothetical protein [Flavobacterium noncentrifugens]SDJ98181.1 hypothetical protein SAMN04487935_2202 [Flavobacterium noncentrifugens]
MKKLFAIFVLLLSSCTTNYFYVTLSDDTPLYNTRSESGQPYITIPAQSQLFISRNGATYRQVKYNNRKLWAVNPNYTISSGYEKKSPGPAASSSHLPSGKTVQVKGYTRKDGTYVRPHTRSAPRRK